MEFNNILLSFLSLFTLLSFFIFIFVHKFSKRAETLLDQDFSKPQAFHKEAIPRSGGIDEFFPSQYKMSFEQFNYQDFEKKLLIVNDELTLKEVGEENFKFISEYLKDEKLIRNFKRAVDGE